MKLAYERLEDRVLLAANVAAKMRGSVLNISGTGGNDSVQVVIDDGQVEVFSDSNHDGHSESLGVFTGVSGININTKRGADQVGLFGEMLPGGIKVKTGAGNDVVVLEDLGITGTLSLSTGNGDDIISFNNVTAGSMSINTGKGNDTVTMEPGSTINTEIFHVILGGGSDIIHLIDEGLNVGDIRIPNDGRDLFLFNLLGDGSGAPGGGGGGNLLGDLLDTVGGVTGNGPGEDEVNDILDGINSNLQGILNGFDRRP